MLEKIRAFVVENYLFGEEGKLGNSDSFMESGIIDSTGILELVMFLESTYKISVATNELLPENFDSINRLALYLAKKLQARDSESVPTAAPLKPSPVG